MVDQVCSPTLDRNHETPEYLLDKDCSAVVFGPPIPAPSLGAVRNRTAHCAIGDRLENWKRLGDRLPVFLTEATQGSLRAENRTSSWQL